MVDAAINEVVADISRMAPRELVHVEVLHSRTVTDESFTSSYDTWVDLANKPIDMQQTVTVTSDPAGTTYTEDTDYIIDYAQGRIQVLSTGSMADATGFLIDYEKSLRGIDLSSLTDFIAVDRLEIAKQGGRSFQEYSSYWQWGDILWLQARDETQSNLSEDDHIRVWYRAEHTKPGASAGSYPAYLDDVVVKGAVAYALFSKHRERNLQAVTDLATARTQLAIADDDQGAIDTLATAVTTALNAAVTALAAAGTPLTSASTSAAAATTALGKADTALATVDAVGDAPLLDVNVALDAVITNLGTEAEALLDVAAFTGMNTSIEAALDAMDTALALIDSADADANTALDALIVQLGTEAEALLDNALLLGFNTAIESALDGAAALLDETSSVVKTALDKIIEHLETDTSSPDSAENQLAAGDSLINATNLGANAPELYARYADAQVSISRGFIDEAQTRIAQARGQIEEASQRAVQKDLWLGEVDRRINIASTYVGEARERLGMVAAIARAAEGYSLEAAQRVAQKRVHLDEVDARINIAGMYVGEARERLGMASAIVQAALGFVREAQEHNQASQAYTAAGLAEVTQAQGYISEAAGRFQQIDRHIQLGNLYLSQSRLYQEGADRENQTADRFLFDAQERHRDYWEHLTSRVEMSWPNQRAAAVRQHPRQNP